MSRIRSWVSGIRDFVSDINPATLSGAIDIIVIRQPDGTLKSSPFHVRFGKLYLLRPKEKVVQITINDEPVRVKMKIGDNGEAFFAPDDELDSAMSAAASVGSVSPPPDRRQRLISETSDSERTVVNFDTSGAPSSSTSSVLPSPTPKHGAPMTPPRKSSRPAEEAAADVPPDRMETIPGRAPADEDDDTLIEWRWGDLPRTEEDARKDAAALQEAAAHAPDGAVVVPHGAVVVPTIGGAAVSGAVMVTGAGALLVPAPESTVSAGPASGAPDPNVPRGAVGVTVTEPEVAAAAVVTEKHAPTHADSPGLLARIGATLWRSAPPPQDDEAGVYLHEVQPVDAHAALQPSHPAATAGPNAASSLPHPSAAPAVPLSTAAAALSAAAAPVPTTATTASSSPTDTPPASTTPHASAHSTPQTSAATLVAPAPAPASTTAAPLPPPTATLPAVPNEHVSSSVLNDCKPSGPPSTSGGSTPDASVLLAGAGEVEEPFGEESEEESLPNDDLDAISFHSTHEDIDPTTPAGKGDLFLDVMEPPPSMPRLNDESNSQAPSTTTTTHPSSSSLAPPAAFDRGASASVASEGSGGNEGALSFPSSPGSRTPTEDRILGPPSLPALPLPSLSSHAASGTGVSGASGAHGMVTPNLVLANMSVRASLCGKANRDYTLAENRAYFDKYAISFDKLNQVPSLYSDPNLVLCIDNKYYPWAIAAPMLLSQLLFQRELEAATLERLWGAERRGGWRSFFFGGRDSKNASALPTPSTLPTPAVAAAAVAAPAPVPLTASDAGSVSVAVGDATIPLPTATVAPAATLVPITAAATAISPTGRSRASLRLSSEQLLKLNLREGANKAVFTIISKMQGKQSVQCNIYLWNHDAKIVISDIDGTITRSDVMGHVAAFLSKDWTHTGVANLYTNIEKNGYKFVYLSSRSISHSGPTRDYLKNVKQGQGEAYKLPDGPVLLSPASLMMSIHLEVIRRKPEEFKVSCLRDIKRLFPRCHRSQCVCCCTPPLGLESFDACTCLGETPFTAGFGNRVTDELSYRAVGISPFRIFIIDPSSRVRASVGAFRSTYEKLNDVVNEVFPPRRPSAAAEPVPSFSDASYWSIPLPAFDDSLLRSVNAP